MLQKLQKDLHELGQKIKHNEENEKYLQSFKNNLEASSLELQGICLVDSAHYSFTVNLLPSCKCWTWEYLMFKCLWLELFSNEVTSQLYSKTFEDIMFDHCSVYLCFSFSDVFLFLVLKIFFDGHLFHFGFVEALRKYGKAVNKNPTHLKGEEETVENILRHEKSAAALLCGIKRQAEALSSDHSLTKDIIGIVATLGKVGDDNLSRLVYFFYSFFLIWMFYDYV